MGHIYSLYMAFRYGVISYEIYNITDVITLFRNFCDRKGLKSANSMLNM